MRRRLLGAALGLVAALSACRGGERSDGPAGGAGASPAGIAPPEVAAPAPPPPAPVASVRRAPAPPSEERLAEYAARTPKGSLQLQLYRESSSIEIRDSSGRRGSARLDAINPAINEWFVLAVDWGEGERFYHLENPAPDSQELRLEKEFPSGLVLVEGGRPLRCDLWSPGEAGPLAEAAEKRTVFAALCEGRLYLRNPTEGRKTAMEATTDFLRDRIWRGEQITVFVRQTLFQDAYIQTSEITTADRAAARRRPRPPGAPARPLLSARHEGETIEPRELGIDVVFNGERRMLLGRWYEARGVSGVYVSAFQAGVAAEDVVERTRKVLNPLDAVESSALIYVVAFDLDHLDLGFALGTDHPRVDWSDRVPAAVRDERLPGPDGIGTSAPLVRSGRVAPYDRPRTVATFTGGFKRTHGAFRAGALALANHGSHYGFIEHGAVLSKLQPGLATLVILDDGTVDLLTWRSEHDAGLARIRHARQNGVPLVEPDPESGEGVPGRLVANWTQGNWSGSVDKRLRALRAGVCLQESEEGRFLLYGYFSTATPSAMARVFVAYRCRYAMLLDMNALEHTYLALYRRQDSELVVDHLIEEMEVLDRSEGDRPVPRFLGFADNRDFFYVLGKEEQ